MLDALITGLSLVFEWPAIGFLFLGVFIGIWFGAVPGLGGVIGLVLLLPFTFGMEPVPAFALLLGMFAVTSTSDTIASVMLGIPGTAASQATILDGYPLAQKGQAARALGAAFSVSASGSYSAPTSCARKTSQHASLLSSPWHAGKSYGHMMWERSMSRNLGPYRDDNRALPGPTETGMGIDANLKGVLHDTAEDER